METENYYKITVKNKFINMIWNILSNYSAYSVTKTVELIA
jgi:hypothetical protein